jgi:putative inorganic carbon (hco3(-)) transporter
MNYNIKNNYPLLIIISIVIIVSIIIFVLSWYEYYLIAIIIIVSGCFLVFAIIKNKYLQSLCALIPFSQPLPLALGVKTIGFMPEYILLPILSLFLIVEKMRQNKIEFIHTGLIIPYALFLLVSGISLTLTGAEIGFARIIPGIGTLYILSIALIVFICLNENVKSENQSADITFVLLASSILVSLYGIIEYIIHYSITNYRIRSFFVTLLWEEGGSNPNSLGTYLMIMVLLGVGIRRVYYGKRKSLINLSLLLNFIALVLSGSRSSLLATLIGGFALGVRRDKRILLVAIPLIGGITYIISTIPRAWDRLTSIISILSDQKVINFFLHVDPNKLDWERIGLFGLGGYNIDIIAGANRFATWVTGIKVFSKFPLLGVGFQMSKDYTGFETAENLWLDIAIMTGVIGMFLFLWWVIRIVKISRADKEINMNPFTDSFGESYRIILLGIFITTLTGSVMFVLKLVVLFWVLTSLQCALHSKRTASN